MKIHKVSIPAVTAAVAVLCLWSCTKEGLAAQEGDGESSPGTVYISVTGELGEYEPSDEGSKAELANTVRVKWEENQKVFVFDSEKCLGVLDAKPRANDDRFAQITGSITTPAEGCEPIFIYGPGLSYKAGDKLQDHQVRVSLASQEGAKAPFVVYGTISGEGESQYVKFLFATSVLRVNCTGLKPSAEVTGINVSGLNTVCVLTLSGKNVTSVGGDEPGLITRKGDSGFDKKIDTYGTGTFSMAYVVTPASERVLTIEQDGGDRFYSILTKGGALNYNQSSNTICQLCLPFTVTAQANDDDWGTVTGGGLFARKQKATLTATPNDGYKFDYWTTDGTESGKIEDAGATYTFTVTADAEYTAVFKVAKYTITAQVNNPDWGTVTGGGEYDENAQATLTATPNDGYKFVEWQDAEGQTVSTDATYVIEHVTGNATYTAVFRALQTGIVITVTVNDTDMGSAQTDKQAYTEDERAVLTATPSDGYAFVEWQDATTSARVSTNAKYVIEHVTGNATYKAVFKLWQASGGDSEMEEGGNI